MGASCHDRTRPGPCDPRVENLQSIVRASSGRPCADVPLVSAWYSRPTCATEARGVSSNARTTLHYSL